MDNNFDLNGNSNETMPPVAPSRQSLLWTAEGNNYPSHYSEQQTVDRLMDCVNKGRLENVRIGQDPAEISIEDAQIVQGAIEIRARIIPKSSAHLENSRTSDLYHQSPYQVQHPNQLPYQSQYQYAYQQPYTNSYPYQSSYQYPYQLPNSLQYQCASPYQFQYQYLNQAARPQFVPYAGQYPINNMAGIANVISQLALSSYLLRRR